MMTKLELIDLFVDVQPASDRVKGQIRRRLLRVAKDKSFGYIQNWMIKRQLIDHQNKPYIFGN